MSRELQVRYFASLADLTGRSAETVTIEDLADVRQVWELLVQRHPALGQLSYRPLVACDLDYARWDRTLEDVNEVAFLPPVSGG